MRFEDATRLISELPVEQSVLLLGPPGGGKTACARAVGKRMGEGALVEVRDLCSHLPEDLLGLPYRENNVMRFSPAAWLNSLSTAERGGVLVLDDLAAAPAAVQVAAFKLVLERRAGDCQLAEGVRVIATANRREDQSGASVLPAALRNRVAIFELTPSVDEWATWAAKNGIDSLVPAFLRFRPALLMQLPKEADARGAFATPRSWAGLGRALRAVRDREQLVLLARAFVGEGPAIEFAAFDRLRGELPDAEAVLRDPVAAVPEPPKKPDVLVALATATAERAAMMREAAVPALLLRALAHVSKNAREFAAVGIQTYESLGGDMKKLVEAAREARSDRGVRSLLKHLDLAVGGVGDAA